MFLFDEPIFQKKQLLRVEMLEQLRDYPRDFFNLHFQGYSDGIVCGCHITWNDGQLKIEPGILYHNRKLYFMKEPYLMDCLVEDKVHYLKVRFLEEEYKEGKVEIGTKIVLNTVKPDFSSELELCRFRLQGGAKLRSRYRDFEDYATEYDTINRIYVPFAAYGQPTIWPELLMQFAKEILENDCDNIYDINFSMNVMANEGKVSGKYIAVYLRTRLNEKVVREGNQNFYRGLKDILKLCKTGKASQTICNNKSRSVILL